MTEAEVARKLEMLCLQNGSEGPSFDTIVLSGSRSAHPHGRPGNNRLSKGKFILIDFGCRYKGFLFRYDKDICNRNYSVK
jgi:Xaa-Pro aminopeptidase